jgi:hypothetical protein
LPEISVLAVVIATGAGFVLGFVYYMLIGGWLADLSVSDSTERPGWQVPVVEIVRNFMLAAVLVGVAAAMDIDSWWSGALLGLALWIGFPLVLWLGAIFHEGTKLQLAAAHAGDWLVKLLAMGVIAGIVQ